ncbi:unnamed protein product, partial [Didymodactylos carnosus]
PDEINVDGERLSSYEGINYYTNYTSSQSCTWDIYWKKFNHFHECPLVKMCYDFLFFIWLLLVFSYMMLYHFDPPDESLYLHWTEIYVIVTIFTMLLEDIRL